MREEILLLILLLGGSEDEVGLTRETVVTGVILRGDMIDLVGVRLVLLLLFVCCCSCRRLIAKVELLGGCLTLAMGTGIVEVLVAVAAEGVSIVAVTAGLLLLLILASVAGLLLVVVLTCCCVRCGEAVPLVLVVMAGVVN